MYGGTVKNKTMTMRTIKTILSAFTFLLLALSCSKWTDTRSLDRNVTLPQDQDPELWAKYTALLREYKAGDHFIVYAKLHNSPAVATSEKDFMRCLPDSLDIVSLSNADNFSKADAEDMPIMKAKGTKVLYHIDYAGRAATDFTDKAKLEAYLDKAVASVKANGMDGYSFNGVPKMDDAATAEISALIVSKLSAARTEGQIIVFEGNPLFVQKNDMDKIDYFVLNTERTGNITELKLQVANATGYLEVPQDRLMLAANISAPFHDASGTEVAAIAGMTENVVALGPLAGLGVYEISDDYYDKDMNYKDIRRAIQTLNPSK